MNWFIKGFQNSKKKFTPKRIIIAFIITVLAGYLLEFLDLLIYDELSITVGDHIRIISTPIFIFYIFSGIQAVIDAK